MSSFIVFFHAYKHCTRVGQYNTIEVSVYNNIASHCIGCMDKTVGKSLSQSYMSRGRIIPHLIVVKPERYRQSVLQ